MNDLPLTTPVLPGSAPGANLPEYTVSELSLALKRSVEENFSHVRVRGEISGFKQHGSGHCYFALKDAEAVLDAVCWRQTAIRLPIKPEDGMEVVCTGRLTTYPGRSKYQLVIDSIALAGVGALLKILEDRRQRLAGEGLFAAERKKKLPFLPEVIGIVTSPSGAVLRDNAIRSVTVGGMLVGGRAVRDKAVGGCSVCGVTVRGGGAIVRGATSRGATSCGVIAQDAQAHGAIWSVTHPSMSRLAQARPLNLGTSCECDLGICDVNREGATQGCSGYEPAPIRVAAAAYQKAPSPSSR